jgi:putative flippase GtrA
MNVSQHFLSKRHIANEFVKFIIIGGVSTCINYFVFFIFFKQFGITYLIASSIGYILGLVVSYFGNKIVTFKTESSFKKKEFSSFFVIYMISLGISLLALHLFVAVLGVPVLVANLLAIGISTVTNFTMLKLFLF